MASNIVRVTASFVIQNKRAAKALWKAYQWVESEAEGKEWDKDARRAYKAMKYAVRHLKIGFLDAD